MLQVPALQLGVPLAELHAFGHEPQCSGSTRKSISQPFVAAPSQLPNPLAQLMPHTPAAQVALPFVELQTLPQEPQFAVSLEVCLSQPSSTEPACGPLQSLKPAAQL